MTETEKTEQQDGQHDPRTRADDDGGWGEWISPTPAAAFGVAGVVAAAVVDAVTGGADDGDEDGAGPVAALSAGDRQYTDEELDYDGDGDVDQDDVTGQTTANLWTGVQTGTMIMAAEGAQQAQLDAIDAIYGND